MPESEETADEIQEIRMKLAAIEATQTLLVRERRDELLTLYKALFNEHPGLSSVYLAVDGNRTQVEIMKALATSGVEMSQPTLSRRVQILVDNGLIEAVSSHKAGKVFEK